MSSSAASPTSSLLCLGRDGLDHLAASPCRKAWKSLAPIRVQTLTSVRIKGENTEAFGRSFKVLGLRLTGRLRIDDARTLASSLVRGVGRRKAYGLGFLAIG